jgi:CheY-like chemotaxis protein
VRDAFEESRLDCSLRCVEDGEELFDYLRRRGKYAPVQAAPRPALILLDLNMPRKDGREVIREIKADPDLRRIPIVVLTTTQAEEDVWRAYDLGVNSFIVKPVVFEALVDVVSTLGKYWFETVELPSSRGR